jgi:glycosyltransferase involved in cell wall biosynthesis
METAAAGPVAESHDLKRKPKLLIVGAFPQSNLKVFGGVVTVCRALVDSSIGERFELVLVDSTQRSNPPPGLFIRVVYGAKRAIAFCRALIVRRPDALVLFCSAGASVLEKGAMAWIARLVGIPALIFPRGGRLIDAATRSRLHRSWIRWSLRGASIFLCQGPTWHRFAVNIVGFPPTHAPIVPNWTATTELLSIGVSRLNRPPGNVPQILFLGWLEKEKGIFELLEACSELARECSFQLVIAGGGSAEDAARRFVLQAGIGDCVCFAGWVQGEDLRKLLTESELLVLPSWTEGLPNAMIEGMAAGLAVVVSAVGNVPDVVTDGREALLVAPKRVDALQHAIRRLLDDPSLRAAIAARGHAFVEQHYAVEPAVGILCQVIDKVMDDRLANLS